MGFFCFDYEFVFLLQDNSKPIVPEVSIIFDEIKLESEEPKSYKQWRDQQRTPAAPVNYGEMIDAKKKFVKFDCLDVSDIEQPRQMIPTHSPVPFNGVSAANTSTNKTMNKIASNQFNVVSQSTKTIHAASNDAVVSMRKPIVTMEDMYKLMSLQQKTMEAKETRCTSNAQSRMPSNETAAQTEITLNDILQLLLRAQQPKQQPDMSQQRDISNTIPIDAVDDQTNAKRVSVINEVQMASAADDEPSLRDLFRIIVKQQEQLINIQQQVQAILVQNNSRLPYNDCHRPICDAHNSFNAAPNPMGVMTSLEINVQKYSHNTKSPSDRKLTPSSNAAVLQCCSNCKSPLTQNPSENNIFVATPANRQNSPNSKPNNANDWTFYGNILNQVNHVLQNSPPANVDSNRSFHTNDQRSHQNHPDPSSPSSSSSSASPNCNNFVTSAQFQQIGLKFDDVNVSATSKR